MESEKKFVVKRDGTQAEIKQQRIRERLEGLCGGLNMDYLNLDVVTGKVYAGIYNGIKTSQLDTLSAETCAYMTMVHPDYSKLASRIEISNLHKETHDDYAKVVAALDQMTDKQGRNASLIHPELLRVVRTNADKINAKIDYSRDFNYDFFGFKTLERSYLLKVDGKIVERPQHMLMRCSLGIHLDDLESAFATYDLMSELWFTHATPTLFNAGTPKP
jgi:ribonucleotide reductase alpha subunit